MALAEHELVALKYQILEWKRKRNAIILAHNYELPEIQDIADVLGDSLMLARAAAHTSAEVIVLCGVHFMAETAAILNPNKVVLLPDTGAGCSLADSITVEQLCTWKSDYPNAVVISYVNTSAEVKAKSDYCCTSSNAVQIVQSIPEDQEILFLPDMFLGSYVQRVTERKNIHIWPGECHVHAGIAPSDVNYVLEQYPQADLLIHPECGCSTSNLYMLADGILPENRTHFLSTNGMLQHVNDSMTTEFVVATEVGILHQMQRQNPQKRFIAANRDAICPFMKMITLPKVLDSLMHMKHTITVPEEIRSQALSAIERMIAIG